MIDLGSLLDTRDLIGEAARKLGVALEGPHEREDFVTVATLRGVLADLETLGLRFDQLIRDIGDEEDEEVAP